VGEIGVHVVKFGDYYLLVFAVPLVIIIGALLWRWWRQRKAPVKPRG
jgi:hypothetical protein